MNSEKNLTKTIKSLEKIRDKQYEHLHKNKVIYTGVRIFSNKPTYIIDPNPIVNTDIYEAATIVNLVITTNGNLYKSKLSNRILLNIFYTYEQLTKHIITNYNISQFSSLMYMAAQEYNVINCVIFTEVTEDEMNKLYESGNYSIITTHNIIPFNGYTGTTKINAKLYDEVFRYRNEVI